MKRGETNEVKDEAHGHYGSTIICRNVSPYHLSYFTASDLLENSIEIEATKKRSI